MEKGMEETTQVSTHWQVHGGKPACQDWHQAVRTGWPEPHAEAHQGRRSAGRCLVSTAARRAGHPGETHTAESGEETAFSSPGWHTAETWPAWCQCSVPWWHGHGWHGTRVSVPATSANLTVPFPNHPPPLRAGPRGGWDSPSPTPRRCRAPGAGSPEAPARLSDPGRLPHPGPQQSHTPPAAARGSSRGCSWGERGDQHGVTPARLGTIPDAAPSAPGKRPVAWVEDGNWGSTGTSPGSCLCLAGASWGSQSAQCKGWSLLLVTRQHPLCDLTTPLPLSLPGGHQRPRGIVVAVGCVPPGLPPWLTPAGR